MSDPLADLAPALAAKLRPLLRRGFRPVLEDADPEGPVSKLGGRPWLPAEMSWPVCPNCEKPMQLLLQLRLDDLPEGAPGHGGGLAQLFYCTNSDPLCEVDCEAFFPFAKSVVAHRVDPTAAGATAPEDLAPEPMPPKAIVGWEAFEDVPNWEERQDEGLQLEDAEETALEDVTPAAGEKLGGWPCWVQGIEYPDCPECEGRMELVFQIDSEQSLPISFGDMGCGHLTQCPEHPDVLAFGWACG